MIRPMLDGSRHRFGVAAAEVADHDRWQRAQLGMAAVSATASHLEALLDSVERFVWSFPEAEVIAIERTWLEVDR